ncbi:MAG: hypothetical protein IE927_02200, partial [Rhodobacterales bacterium]|nr:hypothetical protein [Rhodobacterales bacterium]
MTVAAPRGYCIEQSDQPDPGFVLIGTCQGMRLAGIPLPAFTGRARHPAILTAAVGLPGTALPLTGAEAELTAFFRSADGRAALSRSGQAPLVRVDEARLLDADRGGVFALWLTDDSPLPGGQATAEYWRALMPVRDRMVTLTVTGLRERPVTRDEGLEVLTDFVAAIRRANP